MVADGRLNLTAVSLLAPHLTPDNHAGLLSQACGKKKAEVELLVATHFPRPDVVASLRKLLGATTEGSDWIDAYT